MAVAMQAPPNHGASVSTPYSIRTHIICDRCRALALPGLTSLTDWGLLCPLCKDAYETAHGAGEEGF